MSIQGYLVIFIVTLIIQIFSRFTYVVNKKYISYANYTGADIGTFILKKHNREGILKPIKNSNNYEIYSYQRKSIYLKKSVYFEKSLTSVAIAAQRTYMYILTDNMVGRVRMLIEPFIEMAVKLAWVLVVLALIVKNYSIAIVGIIILFGSFIYNLIYLPLQIIASIHAYRYLEKNIIEKEEVGVVKRVLLNNILFFVTNYSQPLFDAIYYLCKTIFRKLRKKS